MLKLENKWKDFPPSKMTVGKVPPRRFDDKNDYYTYQYQVWKYCYTHSHYLHFKNIVSITLYKPSLLRNQILLLCHSIYFNLENYGNKLLQGLPFKFQTVFTFD